MSQVQLGDPIAEPIIEPGPHASRAAEPTSASKGESAPALTVAELRRVVGRVLDIRTGEPVVGCALRFLQEDRPSKSVETDERGRFETPANFVDGSVDVRLISTVFDVGPAGAFAIQPTRIEVSHESEEFEFLATRGHSIQIRVQNDGGTPARKAGLFVAFNPDPALVPDSEAKSELTASFMTTCNESGSLQLWISPRAHDVCQFSLGAAGNGGVAKSETFEPPLSLSTVTLVLDHGGAANVRVTDPRGEAVAGAKVELQTRTSAASTLVHEGTTDADGRASLTDVSGGAAELHVSHEPSRRAVQRDVELAQRGITDLEIVLPDSPDRLGVRGVVLDEKGDPIAGVGVRVESPTFMETVKSSATGEFEAWMRPSDEVVVEVGPSALDDEFKPPRGRVAFGTTNFVARRVRVPERSKVLVEIVDRTTGKRIQKARVYTAARPDGLFSSFDAKEGRVSVTLNDRPSTCALFAAKGYKSVLRQCRELLPPFARRDDITIELEPGFERRLTFVDGETSTPLEGVSMTQPSGAVVRSDAEGNVFLSSPDWPSPYRVEHDGYFTFEWNPSSAPSWQRVIQLERVTRWSKDDLIRTQLENTPR